MAQRRNRLAIARALCCTTISSDSGAVSGDGVYFCDITYAETRDISRLEPAALSNPAEKAINAELYPDVKICAPGNVRGWRNSSTTALLSWDEPYSTCHLCPDAIGYEVYGEGIAAKNVARPPCEITGLKAGVEYLLYVTAKAARDNVSTPSPFRLLKLRAPAKPGPPELSESTHASLSLFWAPSSYEGTICYRVYLNGFLVKQVPEPLVSLTHLQSHTDYRVEVRTVNEAGMSEPSFAHFKTRVSPPINLRFSHLNGICRVAWDPVFKQLPVHEVSINGKIFTASPGRWGYNFQLAAVSPGPVPHHFKFAVRALFEGESSEVALLEASLTDGVPPTQPGGPVVSNITDTSVTLTWEPSSDNVGVTGYRVALHGIVIYPTQNTHYTLTGLASGAYHWVFIRARDKDGNLSDASPITVFKTTGQAPSPRPSPPPVEITPLTSTTARLDWSFDDNGGVPSGVRIVMNGQHWRDIVLLPGVPLSDLVPDSEYTVSVFAFDLYGQLSEPTTLIYVPKDVTPPSIPGDLRQTDLIPGAVTLAWQASTDDVGLCGYVIYNNHEYFDSTPLTRYTAVDLLPGTYSFEVCAMDLSGNASAPASISVEIQGQPSSPPTNFRYTPTVLITTLEWDAPSDVGDLIRYDIVLTGPQGTNLPFQTANTFLKPVLLPRTRYDVSITAMNASGRSLPLIAELITK